MVLKVYLYRMSKPLKIILIVLASILFLGIVGLFVADAIVKSKIENYLQNSLPESMDVTYSDIEVNVLKGSLLLVSPKIKNSGSTTKKLNAQLDMDSLLIDGFGSWDYVMHKKINIESIQFRQPHLTYYHNPGIDKKDYKYSKLEKLKQDITIDRINIQKGDLVVRNLDTDSLLLKTENFTANVMGLQLNEQTVKRRIPFLFQDYNVHFDNLFYQLSDYENLTVKSSKITKKESRFNELKLFTKYSKTELTKKISVERDHYDVGIKEIIIIDQDFGYKNDSLFFFSSPKVKLIEPHMTIYRNKLVADDNTIKPLYSSMLRSLNFDLTLSTVLIENATINYLEKVNSDTEAGEINFTKLNADITNLSNTYASSEKTKIDIEATFMEQTPIDIEWYFDINDVNDHFIFKADIGRLNANEMNKFTEPNLNVQLKGEIHKTYFTIDGYDHTSTVDLKLNYDDFKVVLMQKNENKKNKLLSALVNIFVSKDSDKRENQYRNGSAEVERDRTKSVFNYIWLNARNGLKDAMTGNGKDEK